MQKNNERGTKKQKPKDSKEKDRAVSWTFFGSGLLIGFLLGVSIGLLDITERAKFIASNALSILALIVIVAQSLIYRKQREIMEAQHQAMLDGLDRTDNVVAEMESQGRLLRRQFELAVANERPYLRLRNWKTPKFEDGFLIVEAQFVNGGRTPAWEVCGHTRVGVDYEPLSPFPPIPSDESLLDAKQSLFIAENDSATLPFTRLKVTENQIRLVQQGRMGIFIDGVCRYFDNLGRKHFYTYGFTLSWGDIGVTPRYERHRPVKADEENPD